MAGFHAGLALGWAHSGSMLCIGLDPDPAAVPRAVRERAGSPFDLCRAIIDATADLACATKPQIAHFAAQRAEHDLERLCAHVRDRHPHLVLILDAKRGDVESTSVHYAAEAFDRYGADAVTVNPYLGTDAARPFLERGGVLAVCRTSNPGAAEVQELDTGGSPLYLRVAEMVATRWAALGECGLVTGATAPAQLARVRATAPDLPLLVPGVGVQGGDLAASVLAGVTDDGRGLIVTSSRSVMVPGVGADAPYDAWRDAVRAEAQRIHDAITASLTGTAISR